MLAGLGRTRRVLMGDTLLANFTPDEIEVIFAHEIGHHVFRHIRKMIAGGAIYTAIGFALVDRLVMAWVHSADPAADYAHFPVYTLPLVMLVLDAVLAVARTIAKRDQPPLRASERSLRARAHRPARGVHFGLSEAGPAEQGRSGAALAGSFLVSQPSAHCRPPGPGRRAIERNTTVARRRFLDRSAVWPPVPSRLAARRSAAPGRRPAPRRTFRRRERRHG